MSAQVSLRELLCPGCGRHQHRTAPQFLHERVLQALAHHHVQEDRGH